MDTDNELLALNAGAYNIYFFNSSGFWFTDAIGGDCTWSASCDYACEIYNYDSRFMDYLGTWTITAKRGFDDVDVEVTAWGGNAIDAAGVFPCILYMDSTTGYYVGLDKLDPDSTEGGCISYFYTEYEDGTPDWTTFD